MLGGEHLKCGQPAKNVPHVPAIYKRVPTRCLRLPAASCWLPAPFGPARRCSATLWCCPSASCTPSNVLLPAGNAVRLRRAPMRLPPVATFLGRSLLPPSYLPATPVHVYSCTCCAASVQHLTCHAQRRKVLVRCKK
jgi:hypothetical protein